MPATSINLADNPVVKIAAVNDLAAAVINPNSTPLTADQQKWYMWFYTYLMWHESAQLTTRNQDGGGPGRGLMQFEATTAWDTAQNFILNSPFRVNLLANAAGVNSDTMRTALQAFSDNGDPNNHWPADGDAGQITTWFETIDSFGVAYMWLQLARFQVQLPPIPPATPDQNPRADDALGQHADVWADSWWKGKAVDRPDRIKSFLASAAALNAALAG